MRKICRLILLLVASWRNWNPDTPLHYKRRSAYWLPPYVRPEQVPPSAYPE